MKQLFEKRLNLIIMGVVIIALIAVVIPLSVNTIQTRTSNAEIETVVSTTEAETATEIKETVPPTELKIVTKKVNIQPTAKAKADKKSKKTVKKVKKNAKPEKKVKKIAKSKKKSKPGFSYATAPKQSGVSYTAQWNAGYLVAIDNPDKNYHPAHVELSDLDRDLLERLCYGEFGDGGFTGAALVAQSVKDAMNTFGIKSVKEVIKSLSYDGRTDVPAGKTIKDAVTYIFDMDKSAVQHRIIYMYDTAYVDSEFHETQNYVCTFKTTRFFDKK